MRRACSSLVTVILGSLVVLAGCASSNGGGAPDAAVDGAPIELDAAVPDALVPDASPDAEPCVVDPDGENCDGNDDDCDGTIDEGYLGVGDACEVGVGTCLRAGTTVCTVDGTATECGVVAGEPGLELCATGDDEDCDGATDEGFDNLGDVCSAGQGACIASGIYVCSGTGLTTQCNATPGDGSVELCNGVDDNCDGQIDEGFQVSQACDGGNDGDLCAEGVWACDGEGGRVCSDPGDEDFDVCNGLNDDCDPTSGDGSEDGAVGADCDGGDGDLCFEGARVCQAGELVCNDFTGDARDVCDGGDNDCDPGSADGSEDPQINLACDSAVDSDLCTTGFNQCVDGGLQCSDDATSTLDLCGGGDDDCDPASADGSEHPDRGLACDSAVDSDLCETGTMACSGTALVCNDDAASILDTCGGGDDDCDPASPDGSEHPGAGASCDGGDSDLCATGVQACSGTTLACTDDAASTVDLCGGGDEDCDGSSVDGSEHPGIGASCDGGDTDLCATGVQACSGAALACTDDAASTVDLCGGGDEDCDPTSTDGTEHPGYFAPCDGSADSDLCPTGNQVCSGTTLTCNDDAAATLDLCGNGNEDCDPASADGSEHAGIGDACDGTDSDLCSTGTRVCSGVNLACNDDAASLVDLCNGVNDDCDGASVDGSEDPAVGGWCDGNDGDACQEAQRICQSGALSCPDFTGTTSETCNGGDDDCDGTIDDNGGNTDMACSSATWYSLGSISGDEGGSASDSWNTEFWDRIQITEDSFSDEDPTATITLTSPVGADYDLYVYCGSCGGTLVGQSLNGGLTGHTDTVHYSANDDSFTWDDGDIIIEVRHWSSTSCASWNLTVQGDTNPSIGHTCDP